MLSGIGGIMNSDVIAVIGLGYVGLPLAVALAKQYQVIGFDKKQARIEALQQGDDNTHEVDVEVLRQSTLQFTANADDLSQANVYIVAVPTPIDKAKQPDLSALLAASRTVGEQLQANDIVIYESTVYPGATEEDCIPVLEHYSKLQSGRDFFVGYSPERINPGDKTHTFESIQKVVSAQNSETLDKIAQLYASVVTAGVFKASSIKVAEAAKVIENTQRDINIAFVNELAMLFKKMDIPIYEVLEAAGTKWNFLPFKPGLVGGHCIGVDPYYLTHKAQELDYHPEMILAGRRINDFMGKHVAELTLKAMLQRGLAPQQTRIGILGFTFKENCPDVRNTRVIDIVDELNNYSLEPVIYDPVANSEDAEVSYGLSLCGREAILQAEVLIIAMAHQCFIEDDQLIQQINAAGLVVDVKNMPDINNNNRVIL